MPPKNSYVDVKFESLCLDLEMALDDFVGEPDVLVTMLPIIRQIKFHFDRVIKRYGCEYENSAQNAVDLVDKAAELGIPSIVNLEEAGRKHAKNFLLRLSDEIHELQIELIATPPIRERKPKKS